MIAMKLISVSHNMVQRLPAGARERLREASDRARLRHRRVRHRSGRRLSQYASIQLCQYFVSNPKMFLFLIHTVVVVGPFHLLISVMVFLGVDLIDSKLKDLRVWLIQNYQMWSKFYLGISANFSKGVLAHS